MYEHALRDYDYVEWNGQASYVAAPQDAPAPALIDTTQVWLSTEREMRYWTSALGVTVYALRDAIADTGTRCAVVLRAHLEPAPAN